VKSIVAFVREVKWRLFDSRLFYDSALERMRAINQDLLDLREAMDFCCDDETIKRIQWRAETLRRDGAHHPSRG
jgi:hypothetical protein